MYISRIASFPVFKYLNNQRPIIYCNCANSFNFNFRSFSDSGPLAGIRILDMTRILAGPFATMILGDLGAEIIKIEKPTTGDDTRQWGPPFIGKESCYFFSINRNKKSVVVNMKQPEGRKLIRELAMKSDILIENFVPGTLEKLNLDYESLKADMPRLIYCSLTGYGPSGPYAKRGGLDVLAASMGGLVGVTGPENGEPCKVGVAMTDLATGLYLHGAVMAALLQRQKGNKGQKIDCNLLSTQIACMVNLASNYLNAGQLPRRWGTAHESIVPYQAFPTIDGYICIGAVNNHSFVNLCHLLQLIELSRDPNYKSNSLRVKNRISLLQTITDKFQTKTTQHWLDVFKDASFPYGPINTLDQVFLDPQVNHSNIVQEVDHTTVGNIKVVGPPVEFSGSENKIRSAPPALGEHTKIVLKETLHYSDSKIEELLQSGVIEGS